MRVWDAQSDAMIVDEPLLDQLYTRIPDSREYALIGAAGELQVGLEALPVPFGDAKRLMADGSTSAWAIPPPSTDKISTRINRFIVPLADREAETRLNIRGLPL